MSIPPKSTGIKKGKSSWKPASVTDVVNKEPGYRYRWTEKSADNMAKKAVEGWEVVSGITSDKSNPTDDGRIDTGKKLTSTYEKLDVILQRIPEDKALERDEYYNDLNSRRVSGLTAHLKKEVGNDTPIHGNITISSRRGSEIIE